MLARQLDSDIIESLMGDRSYPAISILLPTHRASTPNNLQQDKIRLKNLITEVEKTLKNHDAVAMNQRKDIVSRLRQLQEDTDFLSHQDKGLALFVSDDQLQAVKLPHEVKEHIVVNEHFHVSPLIAMLQENKSYFVLQLSDNNPRLLYGDMFEVKEVEVNNMPTNRKQALNIDEFQQEQQFHSGGDTGGRAMYHGHGANDSMENEEQRNYYKVLDQLIYPHIAETSAPVILAGVKRDITMYKNVSKLGGRISEDSITGSIERLSLSNILDKVRDIIKIWNNNEAYEARTTFKRLMAAKSTKAIFDLNDIRKAAAEGRIAQLLMQIKDKTTDTVEKGMTKRTVFKHEEIDADDLDQITLATYAQSGSIFGLDASMMPATSPMVAILRY